MLFLGGMAVGALICIVLDIVLLILWHKLLKKKVEGMFLKMGLKAIEANKEKYK